MKIKKKDKVLVICGKDRGKTGEITRVLPKENKIAIAGVNIVKKATKASKKNPGGGIIEFEKPISASNVSFLCPSCNKPARVGYQITKSGQKERFCKACKAVVKE